MVDSSYKMSIFCPFRHYCAQYGLDKGKVVQPLSLLRHFQDYVRELREHVADLEEDNRVLAEAAGWEICQISEVRDVPTSHVRLCGGLT